MPSSACGRVVRSYFCPTRGGFCEVVVAGRLRSAVAGACDWLDEILRDEGKDKEESIPVNFWCDGSHGPEGRRKAIDAPEWPELRHNYTAAARAGLGKLMDAEGPGAGSLLLWHGPPGTGKSHALRALARRWQGWCSTQYITDPERFLGAGTSYLMEVAVEHDDARAEAGNHAGG